MSKRFEFKLRRLISSSLRICRSRNPASFPENPLPNESGCPRLSTINRKANEIGSPDPPPSTPEDSFVSVKVIRTIGHPRRDHEEDSGLNADSIEYSWREDGRWHVVNKRVDHEADDDELEPVMIGRYGKSERGGDGAVMGKRDDALVSMRVFSGKSGSNETKSLLSSSRRFWNEEEEHGEVASVSVMEQRMFEAGDLELLRCFLSLNSKEYHGIIVEAFSELWQMIFCIDHDSAEFTK